MHRPSRPRFLQVTLIALVQLTASVTAHADYAEHIEAVREVGARFPGSISPIGYEHRTLGLWAGNLIQTLWQNGSGRSEIPLWSVVNRALTIEPRDYGRAFLRGEPCPAGDTVCPEWYLYFSAAGTRARPALKQKFFWRAHRAAIHRAVSHDEIDLLLADVPELERRYWSNWIALVDTFEARQLSSQDWAILPLSRKLSPPCAPLGASGCQLDDLSYRRRQFVAILTSPEFDAKRDFWRIFALALSS